MHCFETLECEKAENCRILASLSCFPLFVHTIEKLFLCLLLRMQFEEITLFSPYFRLALLFTLVDKIVANKT